MSRCFFNLGFRKSYFCRRGYRLGLSTCYPNLPRRCPGLRECVSFLWECSFALWRRVFTPRELRINLWACYSVRHLLVQRLVECFLILFVVLCVPFRAIGQQALPFSLPLEIVFADSSVLHSPPWIGDCQRVRICDGALRFAPAEIARELGEDACVSVALPVQLPPTMSWQGEVALSFVSSEKKNFTLLLYCLSKQEAMEQWVALEFLYQGRITLSALSISPAAAPAQDFEVLDRDLILSDISEFPLSMGEPWGFHVTVDPSYGWRLWLKDRYRETFYPCGNSAEAAYLPTAPSVCSKVVWQYRGSAKSVKNNQVEVFSMGMFPVSKPPQAGEASGDEPQEIECSSFLLNEIYANPGRNGAEYIELINPTEQPLDLSNYAVGIERYGYLGDARRITDRPHFIPPHGTVALSREPQTVIDYFSAPSDSVLLFPLLPQLANKGFVISLVDRETKQLVDRLEYSPALLAPLPSQAHAALERYSLDPQRPVGKSWAAALASYRYGTPGTVNSLVKEETYASEVADSVDQEYLASSLHVNEILFLPAPHESEFVELFNAGMVPIPLHHYAVALRKDGHQQKAVPLMDKQQQWLHPKQYVALVPDAKFFATLYPDTPDSLFLQVPALPVLPNRGGSILLLHLPADTVAEEVPFLPDFYPHELKQKEGVSLERINPFLWPQEPSNWTVPLESQGYKPTPGRENSVVSKGWEVDVDKHPDRSKLLPLKQLASRLLLTDQLDSCLFISHLIDMQGNRVALMNRAHTLRWCQEVLEGRTDTLAAYAGKQRGLLVLIEIQFPNGAYYCYGSCF